MVRCVVGLLAFLSFVGVSVCCVATPSLAQDKIPQLSQISPEILQQKIDADTYALILKNGFISRDDVKTYKNIFLALKDNDIETADELRNELTSDVLDGHILAEKFLSKNYKSSYEELKNWLHKYPDYPQAQRIYNLALKKNKAAAETELDNPKLLRLDSYNKKLYARNMDAYENLSPKRKKIVTRHVTAFYRYLGQGKTLKARKILENYNFRMAVPDKYWDEMSAALAQEYFLDNQNSLALKWTQKPMKRSKNQTAYWIAGLASWRLKNFQNAALYFARLAQTKNDDEWLEAAGAFWAYRSYHKLGNKQKARRQLEIASAYQRTFYGILAAHVLGLKINYNWSGATYWNDFSNPDYAQNMVASTSIRRAVLLFHAKRPDLAEQELAYGYENMNEKQKEAVLFLLNNYQRHAMVIHLAKSLRAHEKGVFYDNLAYPVPDFLPDELKADKALILAVSRQESAFNPYATSSAGARGLMQLMPNTAFHVTQNPQDKKDKSRLFDVAYNLEVGQRYLHYLLEKSFIDGNLFFMLTAYNAGPGNLVKWLKTMKYNNDPLLFIEVIPARQTRLYIEKVMANYWIYGMQLNLPEVQKTLDDVAHGKFPILP